MFLFFRFFVFLRLKREDQNKEMHFMLSGSRGKEGGRRKRGREGEERREGGRKMKAGGRKEITGGREEMEGRRGRKE